MKPAFVAAACLAFATACAGPPIEERGCKNTVTAAVAPLGVTAAEVDAATVAVQTDSGEDPHVIGYNYWIDPKVCSAGHLVVDTTNYCHVLQVYTTGACQISGLKHY